MDWTLCKTIADNKNGNRLPHSKRLESNAFVQKHSSQSWTFYWSAKIWSFKVWGMIFIFIFIFPFMHLWFWCKLVWPMRKGIFSVYSYMMSNCHCFCRLPLNPTLSCHLAVECMPVLEMSLQSWRCLLWPTTWFPNSGMVW